MQISTTAARAEFTNALIDIYKERVAPSSFLRSFFKKVEKSTLSLSIAVQRGTEQIAVDVERGTDGNRNSFDKTTEKIFVPPYYSEYFNINELDVYNSLFASENIEASVFTTFMEDVMEKMLEMQSKIERAYELQCAQVLNTGIVQLAGGINIDFKRKAGSLVDLGAGNYFASAGVNPMTALAASGKFLREVGKSQGGVYNAIFGDLALNNMLNNPLFVANMDIKSVSYGEIREPQRAATGATLHGRISGGAYVFNVWSYADGYENTAGVFINYLDPKKVIVIPETPKFTLGFAAVPQLPTAGGSIKTGAFVFEDYIDPRKKNHIMEVQSAGVAIPTAVDQIYTFKAVA